MTVPPPPRRAGASGHNPSGLRSVWSDEAYSARSSRGALAAHAARLTWRAFVSSPLTSLLTVAIISVVLFLLGGLLVFYENVGSALAARRGDVAVDVYLKPGAGPAATDRVLRLLGSSPGVGKVTYFSPEENFTWFKESLGDDGAFLGGPGADNPLPGSFEVRPRGHESDAWFDEIVASASEDPAVETARYDRGVVGTLAGAARSLRTAGVFVVILMVASSSLLIANTIRLALYAHRDEIDIQRLVGATERAIGVPYVAEGLVQGTAGALAALVLLRAALGAFGRIVSSDPVLSAVIPPLSSLSLASSAGIVAVGALVGGAGSHAAVKRFLRPARRGAAGGGFPRLFSSGAPRSLAALFGRKFFGRKFSGRGREP